MLGSKAGVVHLHIGKGQRGLGLIFDVIERTEIPIGQFLPTHVSKKNPVLLEEAIDFIEKGGNIDITADSDEDKTVSVIRELREGEVNLAGLTMSSDGNGSMPRFNDQGELIGMATGNVSSLGEVLRDLVNSNVLPLSDALKPITSNPADRLGLSDLKGRIQEGADADLVILAEDLQIDQVFAKGQLMVDKGNAVVKGIYE